MSNFVKAMTEASFDAEIASPGKLVLVDFMADWCAPCRQIAPVVEEIAEAYDGQLVVGKVNADDNPELARRLGVRGLPTLMLFKDGQEVERAFMLSKTRLAAMIEAHLSTTEAQLG
jgi:thioredoxin 1